MTRPNLRVIAGRAGVSPATVSLALRDDPRVAQATRERIQKLADRLGYVPDNLGRALQSRRSRLVGYLLPDVTASFNSEVLQGIGETAARAGYDVITSIYDRGAESLERHLRAFREKNVDGVLASLPMPRVARGLARLEEEGVPIVICSEETFDPKIPFVVIDNRGGAALAAKHLLELGHRRLAFCFGGGLRDRRYRGAAEAAEAAGCPRPTRCLDRAGLQRLLRAPRRPTGIVADSDFSALEVRREVAAAGLRVPEDVSVVGFDDMWFAAMPEFSLTTVAQPKREIGSIAMEMLLERIEGREVKGRRLAPELVVRESTAPPGTG